MPTIEFGVNNGFALKNWPEPMAWAKIIAQDLGLKHVQFSFDLLDPLFPEPARTDLCGETLQAVRRHGLSLLTTFTGLIAYAQNLLAHPSPWVSDRAWHWFEAALEVTQKLEAEGTGGYIGAMSVADFADSDRRGLLRNKLIQSIRRLTHSAREHGLKYLLWEFMPTPRELPHTPEEAIELIEEVNQGAALPVYLCFDLGHCCSFDLASPGDPHKWLEKLLPWTPMVHLQQTDGKGDHHWPFSPEYNKSSIINPERIVEIVRGSPFERVDLILELSHPFEAPDRQIIEDHQWSVEAWLKWI